VSVICSAGLELTSNRLKVPSTPFTKLWQDDAQDGNWASFAFLSMCHFNPLTEALTPSDNIYLQDICKIRKSKCSFISTLTSTNTAPVVCLERILRRKPAALITVSVLHIRVTWGEVCWVQTEVWQHHFNKTCLPSELVLRANHELRGLRTCHRVSISVAHLVFRVQITVQQLWRPWWTCCYFALFIS